MLLDRVFVIAVLDRLFLLFDDVGKMQGAVIVVLALLDLGHPSSYELIGGELSIRHLLAAFERIQLLEQATDLFQTATDGFAVEVLRALLRDVERLGTGVGDVSHHPPLAGAAPGLEVPKWAARAEAPLAIPPSNSELPTVFWYSASAVSAFALTSPLKYCTSDSKLSCIFIAASSSNGEPVIATPEPP